MQTPVASAVQRARRPAGHQAALLVGMKRAWAGLLVHWERVGPAAWCVTHVVWAGRGR